MQELFSYLKTLPPIISLVVLCIFVIILMFSKRETLKNMFNIINGTKRKKRTCGDCVLILFGIREKYDYQIRKLSNELLKKQMTFSEQKIQEVVFYLAQSFSEDIKILGNNFTNSQKLRESALYCEALKNSLLSVKDELRRSFKDNGFSDLSQTELQQYIKNKVDTLITIARAYLKHHYVETEETIVTLDFRFKKMDSCHKSKIEDIVSQMFNKAKDLVIIIENRRGELDKSLKSEIDAFVINGKRYEKSPSD